MIKKRRYFHGTNADNLPSILKKGLTTDNDSLWLTSYQGIYLWCPKRLGKCEDLTTEKEMINEAKRRAIDSGSVGCCKAKDCRIVLIEVELNPSEVEDDSSSENMDGAVYISRNIKLSEIVSISISNDLNLIRGYYIMLYSNNEYRTQSFTDLELKVAKMFSGYSICIEDIEAFYTFEPVELKKRKTSLKI